VTVTVVDDDDDAESERSLEDVRTRHVCFVTVDTTECWINTTSAARIWHGVMEVVVVAGVVVVVRVGRTARWEDRTEDVVGGCGCGVVVGTTTHKYDMICGNVNAPRHCKQSATVCTERPNSVRTIWDANAIIGL
jgi:hypothetical protein